MISFGDAVQSRIVLGENIAQTAQFVETGNADAGIVALSLVLSPKLAKMGKWQEIPADDYARLEQAAVLTKQGAGQRVGSGIPGVPSITRERAQFLIATVSACLRRKADGWGSSPFLSSILFFSRFC